MWMPTSGEILGVHEEIVRKFPGMERGILSQSIVEAAASRAAFGPFGVAPTFYVRSAFVVRGIAQDHPFVDGNKRTALAVLVMMCRENGLRMTAGNAEAEAMILDVAKGQVGIVGIAAWIAANTENYKASGRP